MMEEHELDFINDKLLFLVIKYHSNKHEEEFWANEVQNVS